MSRLRYPYYLGLILLCFACTPKPIVQHISSISNDNINIGGADHAAIETIIAPYRVEMAAEMEVVIGQVSTEMVKSKLNGTLCNWVADMLYDQSQQYFEAPVDFAIQNYGGLRVPSIAAGPITKGKVFELMPFDNMLVAVSMSSTDVTNLCNRMADYGGWPVSEQLSFIINNGIAEDIKINGEPLSSDTTYSVAMPDYIANGGDTCPFMIGLPQDNSGLFIREVLIDGIERITVAGQSITPSTTTRISTL